MALELKNGKFFRDGNPVPLEFGNIDQIKLIANVKQLKIEGAVPALIFDQANKFICGLSLKCVCGERVVLNWETEAEGYEIEGTTVPCPGCDFLYVVCADEDNSLYYKLKS